MSEMERLLKVYDRTWSLWKRITRHGEDAQATVETSQTWRDLLGVCRAAAQGDQARVLLSSMIQQGRLKMHGRKCGYWQYVPCWGSMHVVDETQEAKGEAACTCEIKQLREWVGEKS